MDWSLFYYPFSKYLTDMNELFAYICYKGGESEWLNCRSSKLRKLL